MKLVITIDTEEDNWRPFSSDIRTRNAREIARVHDLFVDEDVRPTYLVTWPMALDDVLVDTLGGESRDDRCEIGTHCHPWTTPPVNEAQRLYNSMLCNLSRERVATKLGRLHTLIADRFGTAPKTFRAGRWALGPHVAEVLHQLNYHVDTSITAFTDWSPQFGPDYSLIGPNPYRFTPPHIYSSSPDGPLIELPATAGFLGSYYGHHAHFERLARKRPLRWFRILGILKRLSLHNRVTLSPECADTAEMVALIDNMHHLGFEYLNLFFHSPTLVPGLTPYVKTQRDLRDFMQRLRTVIRHARSRGYSPTLARDVSVPVSREFVYGGPAYTTPPVW